ncbi:MAG: NADP-dependent oxidoreductase [Mycobacteriaceae bacterium]
MRAVYQESFGDRNVLQVGEQPDPLLGPDTIVVRVRAAGVNPVDWKIREGYLQQAFPHVLPLVPGWDAAGVVESVGPAVRHLAPGDEVLGYVRKDTVSDGTYAELVSASARHLARKPAAVGFDVAGALPLAGLTALQSLDAVGVSRGDTVLVHAAAGGVGHLATQLAVARGARVIGTASERNHEFLRALGAEPVAYGDGLVAAVRSLAPDGVDAAVDYVGGDAITASAELVADPARTASNVDPDAVAAVGGVYCFVQPDATQLAELVAMVDAGVLRVEIQERFPLDRAADAHQLLEDGHVRGKLVLTV